MDAQKFASLRTVYHDLVALETRLRTPGGQRSAAIEHALDDYTNLINRANGIERNLLNPRRTIVLHAPKLPDGKRAYSLPAILLHLDANIGRIRRRMNELEPEGSVEPPPLPFISNHQIRQLIREDYRTLHQCMMDECWKPAIILAAGILEAILLNELQPYVDQGIWHKYSSKPLGECMLGDLIKAAGKAEANKKSQERVFDKIALTTFNIIKDHRNLVHCSVALSSELQLDAVTARAAFVNLQLIIDGVNRRHAAAQPQSAGGGGAAPQSVGGAAAGPG